MNEKDCMLHNQINTITNKLESFSFSFDLDFVMSRLGHEHAIDREPNPHDSTYGEMLNKTLKSLDYMKKCIESKEYNKTLYIDVIKRVYLFVEAAESDDNFFELMTGLKDSQDELVEGMHKLSMIFNGEATDILRTLLDYIEKANLPVKELPWEYQALVNAIIGIVHVKQHMVEYLIMILDEILIECGLCEEIPNIGEPIEGEECSTTINTSSMGDCFLDGVFDDQEEKNNE